MDRDPFSEEKLDEIRREFPTLSFIFDEESLIVYDEIGDDLLSLYTHHPSPGGYIKLGDLCYCVEVPHLGIVRDFLNGIETVVLYRAEKPIAWQFWDPIEKRVQGFLEMDHYWPDPYDLQTYTDENYTRATVKIEWRSGISGLGDPEIASTVPELIGPAPASRVREILGCLTPFEFHFDVELDESQSKRWVPIGQSNFEVLLPIEWRINLYGGYHFGTHLAAIPYDSPNDQQSLEFIIWFQNVEPKNTPVEWARKNAEVDDGEQRRWDYWDVFLTNGEEAVRVEVVLYSHSEEFEAMANYLDEHLPLIRLRAED